VRSSSRRRLRPCRPAVLGPRLVRFTTHPAALFSSISAIGRQAKRLTTGTRPSAPIAWATVRHRPASVSLAHQWSSALFAELRYGQVRASLTFCRNCLLSTRRRNQALGVSGVRERSLELLRRIGLSPVSAQSFPRQPRLRSTVTSAGVHSSEQQQRHWLGLRPAFCRTRGTARCVREAAPPAGAPD
jgi:hypothetical protein